MEGTQSVVLTSTLLVLYNSLTNLLPREFHSRSYIPLNLSFLVVMVVLSVAVFELDRASLGLQGNSFASLLIGASVGMTAIAAAVLVRSIPLTWISRTIKRLETRRMTRPRLLYILLLHIPLGTAVFEELLFRGILFGLAEDAWNDGMAVLVTSLVFVAWHTIPAAILLRGGALAGYELVRRPVPSSSVAALAIAFTAQACLLFFAGVSLAFLRLTTHSVIAPILVHALVNLGYLALSQGPDDEASGLGTGSLEDGVSS